MLVITVIPAHPDPTLAERKLKKRCGPGHCVRPRVAFILVDGNTQRSNVPCDKCQNAFFKFLIDNSKHIE
jgi:hypothetical protein